MCTWAGKLWKLDSFPMKPWIYTAKRVRRPSPPLRPDSAGSRECVELDRGSLERHCSDIKRLLLASSVVYGGGLTTELPRAGSGGGRPRGGSSSREHCSRWWANLAFSESWAGVAIRSD